MKKTIEISDETTEVDSLEYFVGQKLFIRTVTYHMVGEVTKLIGKYFQLKNASWVADSGRFMFAIKYGTLDEVEPVGEAFINTDSIVDIFPWKHTLPTK